MKGHISKLLPDKLKKNPPRWLMPIKTWIKDLAPIDFLVASAAAFLLFFFILKCDFELLRVVKTNGPDTSILFVAAAFATLLLSLLALFTKMLQDVEKCGYLLLASSLGFFYLALPKGENARETDLHEIIGETVPFVEKVSRPLGILIEILNRDALSPDSATRSKTAINVKKLATEGVLGENTAASIIGSVAVKSQELGDTEGLEIAQKSGKELQAVFKDVQLPSLNQVEVTAKQQTTDTPTLTSVANASSVVSEVSEADAEKLKKNFEGADATVALVAGSADAKAEIETAPEGAAQATAPLAQSTVEVAAPAVAVINELPASNLSTDPSPVATAIITQEVVNGVTPNAPGMAADAAKAVGEAENVSSTPLATPAVDTVTINPPPTETVSPVATATNKESALLEAELLAAIKVIEASAKKSTVSDLPFLQVRELQQRIAKGDLRKLGAKAKTTVEAALEKLLGELKAMSSGGSAGKKKSFPTDQLLRVGFFFPKEEQRLQTRLTQLALNHDATSRFYCPAIQNVGIRGHIPPITEVRYFKNSIWGFFSQNDAKDHAKRLVTTLKKLYPKIGAVKIRYYEPERPDEIPGNFEVWFSENAFSN